MKGQRRPRVWHPRSIPVLAVAERKALPSTDRPCSVLISDGAGIGPVSEGPTTPIIREPYTKPRHLCLTKFGGKIPRRLGLVHPDGPLRLA